MIDWSIAVPSFLTALVEWVEAFTIVLAVSLSIGWRAAIGASLAGLATLAALTLAAGRLLATGVDIGWVQLVVGVFLLLFGVRWLAKAVARHAGLKALHDEALEFEQTRARLTGEWAAGWAVAYKGVLLEGLEVWLVVVALGMKTADGTGMASSGGAAIAALLLTCAVGAAVRAPLQRVPENAIKLTVGAMIVAFGTYWTMEGIGGSEVWPLSDWTLPILGAFYLAAGLAVAAAMRARVRRAAA
jgi:uncharacterized membrane protein